MRSLSKQNMWSTSVNSYRVIANPEDPVNLEEQHTVLSSQKQWQDRKITQGYYLLFQFFGVCIGTSSCCGLSSSCGYLKEPCTLHQTPTIGRAQEFDFLNTDHAHGDKNPPGIMTFLCRQEHDMVWVHHHSQKHGWRMLGRDRVHSPGSIPVNVQFLGKEDQCGVNLWDHSLSLQTLERKIFHGMTYTLVVLNLLWRSFHFALMFEGV